MNYDRSLLFSYLEEDNIQRAYFRVRPLLTVEGDIRDEAAQLWPNEGCLRIVPDRNEQHTFKVRMRTLGPYCVVDLRGLPADAGKIRTNKNFRPEKGEVNQFILYSDTVQALPENTFYQIVDGKAEQFADLAKDAVTPLFFIRAEDTLYGPVRKDAPAQPDTAKEAAGVLFELPCPDGTTRWMLCMDDAPVAAPTPAEDVPVQEAAAPSKAEESAETPVKAEDEALPVGEKLNILNKDQSHEETLHQLDQPVSAGANLLHRKETPAPVIPVLAGTDTLSGTPLVHTPLRVSTPQAKNRTQEIVRNQWSVGKYEPPAQSLPAGAKMRDVVNPVEAACTSLRSAWSVSGARDQLADLMLSLDGARGLLERKLCQGSTVTIMQRVLRDRLQDLEAERLTALCELDKAHRDVDAYKQELLAGMAARIAKETAELEAARDAAKSQSDALKAEVNALTLQRDALLDKVAELQTAALPEAAAKLLAEMQMAAPVVGVPLRMSPAAGQKIDREVLIQRVMDVFATSGAAITRNEAIVLLVLLAVSPRIGVSCPTPAPLGTLVGNLMSALGWQSGYAHQYAAEQRPVCGLRPVDATPAILMTSLPNYAPIPGITKVCLNRMTSGLIRNAAYDTHPWPVLILEPLGFVPELDALDAPPISFSAVQEMAAAAYAGDAEITRVLGPILDAAAPLSGPSRKEMFRFVSVCAGLLEGGLPAAVDQAVSLWIVPALDKGSKHCNAVKALLNEYPISLAKL